MVIMNTNYSNEQLFEAGTRVCKSCNERKLLSTDFWHKKRGMLNLSKCGSCISSQKKEYYRQKKENRLYKPMTEDKLKYFRDYYKTNKVKIECDVCNTSLYKHNLAKHQLSIQHKNKLNNT